MLSLKCGLRPAGRWVDWLDGMVAWRVAVGSNVIIFEFVLVRILSETGTVTLFLSRGSETLPVRKNFRQDRNTWLRHTEGGLDVQTG